MEPHQSVRVTSSWSVQGPYDIHSVLQVQLAEETSENSTSVSTHNIKLAPPPSANEDDEATPPCQVFLACQSCIAIGSIEVVSNARHIELYDNQDAYCCTVRGEKQTDREDDQRTDLELYSARLTVDSPVPHCRLKFVSLTDKFQLTLVRLWVTMSRAEPGSFTGLGSRSIDMAKVRDMMSSLQQPIPDNVESLMQTVEQYQKNQATVLEDFQQVATERLSASTAHDPKASLASNMTGLLSAFSKATSMQQQARTRPTTTTSESNTHNAVSSINNPAPSRQPQTFDMDSLSKLMASFGGTTQNTETGCSSSDTGQDMFNSLRMMCRDVSNMRAADRQAAERSYGAERRNDREGQEVDTENRETVKPDDSHASSKLEQRLMGYITATEERIMGRFDRQIELLRDHIDLRFNKLEALLEERSKGTSDQNNELQTEDVD